MTNSLLFLLDQLFQSFYNELGCFLPGQTSFKVLTKSLIITPGNINGANYEYWVLLTWVCYSDYICFGNLTASPALPGGSRPSRIHHGLKHK